MREIKFRGKKKQGEWVYGNLIQPTRMTVGNSKNINDIYCLIVESSFINGGYASFGRKHWVLKETLGQFTGLQDKNGVDIYEGDIAVLNKMFTKLQGEIKYGTFNYSSCDEYNCSRTGYYISANWSNYVDNTGFPINRAKTNDIEVIGNIHDNPELLEEEER